MNPKSKQAAHAPPCWEAQRLAVLLVAMRMTRLLPCTFRTQAKTVEDVRRKVEALPDLLEACQSVLRLDYFCEHNALAEQVRSAIAKATGGEV